MGRLRVVPKVMPLQFVEVQGLDRETISGKGRSGVVLRSGNLQVEILPDVDHGLLKAVLGFLGDVPC